MPDLGFPTELVRGEVIRMNIPVPRHGQVCGRIDRLIGNFVDANRLGHVLTNDSGIITERNPDTVRGGDVWYISYSKISAGPLPSGYLEVAPDIVFEVLSHSDRRSRLYRKIGEYLALGVSVVCVVDPRNETVQLCTEDGEVNLSSSDDLTFPEQLPGFRVSVQALFQ